MSTIDAIVKQMNAVEGGSFLVRNGGGYVARFSVSYKFDGKDFSKDSGDFSLGVNKSISVPAGATDIHLKVEEAWFIASWTTIFTQNFGSPVTKCYKIWGTTLNPSWEETSCG
jgi:hypothetical protein